MDQSSKDLRYQSSKALSQMTNHIKHVKSEGFIVHTFKTLHIEFYEKNANGSFFLVGTYTKCKYENNSHYIRPCECVCEGDECVHL